MTESTLASTLPLPPLENGPPIVGHLPGFIRARGPLLTRLYERHGPCFRIRLGLDTPVVMAGPEMAEFANRDAGRMLHAGPSNIPFVREIGGSNMMLGADQEPHFQRRRNVMPQFTPGAVMKMVPRFSDVAREAATEWSRQGTFELLPRLKRLVNRQTGLALVGTDSDPVHEDLCRFFDLAIAVTFARVPRWTLRFTDYDRARSRVHAFARTILDARAAVPAEARPGDLLDLILDAREADGSPLDPDEQQSLVLAPFVGGLDTVSHTMAFLIYEVCANPDLYARCQVAADTVFDGDVLDGKKVRSLEIIGAAIQETFRRHPVSELGQRVAAEDFEFAGCRIEKGTKLLLGWSVANALASKYPEPERFDAERFLPLNPEMSARLGAFGFGPHKCIGARLAEVQMMVTLATLLRFTKMELASKEPLRVSSLIARKPVDLRVRVAPRTPPALA